MGFIFDPNDPLSQLMAPPPDETPTEKMAREGREAEARRVSDKIDEGIKHDRISLKKQKNIVKVLLLGQSESGKSTTLKNFRMKHARAAWKSERIGWRSVIQLNIIRSIVTIVETLQHEVDGDRLDDSSDDEKIDTEATREPLFAMTDKLKSLKLRLGPLRRIEADLKKRLGASTEEIQSSLGPMQATPFDAPLSTAGIPVYSARRANEFMVRCWKDALEPVMLANQDRANLPAVSDVATEVIAECLEDMKALWKDEAVGMVLNKRKVQLEDSAGFFLDDLDRIATRSYEPSDDDVVRARLRTLAVQDHKLYFDDMPGEYLPGMVDTTFGREWIMYDVGGARTSRAAWLPYFDDVNAIIFLAPISCFDERLAEDRRINRLEDSFILWTSICSSTLLAKTTMILFLNKCDLLKRKLKRGVQVNKHLTSYGDRPNELNSVVKYLRDKFRDTLNQHSPEPRTCYIYPTSVTDTKSTATTLTSVRDGILREHLKKADFM